jgi:hypothetical protein
MTRHSTGSRDVIPVARNALAAISIAAISLAESFLAC